MLMKQNYSKQGTEGGRERDRERERELMFNILPNNRYQTPIVLVNRIQMSSCLIHGLTLCGHPECQCMQLFQEGHCVGLCHPYNGAGWLTEAWCCWNKGFVSPELLSIRDQMCSCILGQNASMQMQIWMFGQHIKSTQSLWVYLKKLNGIGNRFYCCNVTHFLVKQDFQ